MRRGKVARTLGSAARAARSLRSYRRWLVGPRGLRAWSPVHVRARQQLPPTLLLLSSFYHGRTYAQVQCDDEAAHMDMGQLPLAGSGDGWGRGKRDRAILAGQAFTRLGLGARSMASCASLHGW